MSGRDVDSLVGFGFGEGIIMFSETAISTDRNLHCCRYII